MARSDNTADGRLDAEPRGTRSSRPQAASLRLCDPSTSGSRSPSLLACNQHAQRRGLASLPNRLGSRKTHVAITPATGIGGTTSQTFQYDGLNRPTQNQDISSAGTVQVTSFYDSLGRSIEESPVTLGTGSRYVTNTTFTSIPGTQFEYPNNRLVNSGYDVLYRKKQIIEAATSAVIATWQFYGPGRIAEVALANGLAQSYLNNARTNSAVQSPNPVNPPWGNNTSDRLGYDGAGRNITKRYLSSTLNAQNGYANTTALVGNTTAFDRTGGKFYERALQTEERDNLYQPVSSTGNVASPTPGYDSVNRLLQYQRGTLNSTGGYQLAGGGSVTAAITLPNTDQSRTYNLDGLGNWKTSTFTPVGGSQSTDQRSHNYVNEITQRTLTGGSAVAFQYDGKTGGSNGNLKNDGTLIYAYDALNRLIQVNRVSDGLIIATYDAMNRRVRKTIFNGGLTGSIPNGTTDYIWQGWQCMEERNSSNAPIRQYIWGTYIDECIQLTTVTILGPQNLPAGAYYLLQDLLYRAVALTNSNGSIVEAYDCDAYGNTLIFTGPGTDGVWFTDDDVQSSYGANEIIYCGYRFNPEAKLYYVRNRTYSPILGRWIQRDPIGYAGGVNLYEYVEGFPSLTPDPLGLLGLYLDKAGLQKLARLIEGRLESLGTQASISKTLLLRAELFSGRVLLLGQIEFFLAVGLLKAALSIVEDLYEEPTIAALSKKFGKKFVEEAIKHWYDYLKRQHDGVVVIQSGDYGKKKCHADMVVTYQPSTQRFEATVTGLVGKIGEPTSTGGQFTCDCSADPFTLYVTGSVIEGKGVNFNYMDITNVNVEGP